MSPCLRPGISSSGATRPEQPPARANTHVSTTRAQAARAAEMGATCSVLECPTDDDEQCAPSVLPLRSFGLTGDKLPVLPGPDLA